MYDFFFFFNRNIYDVFMFTRTVKIRTFNEFLRFMYVIHYKFVYNLVKSADTLIFFYVLNFLFFICSDSYRIALGKYINL